MPMGVASLKLGGAGLNGRCISVSLVSELTGLALGEGGIASPSLGALEPLLLRLPPGTGGRSNGAGEVIVILPSVPAMQSNER